SNLPISLDNFEESFFKDLGLIINPKTFSPPEK
ncbi:unnamed protein product, partial [marine sediment metagenome]